ncbi:hypothetical protein EYF80_051367 [Liparis tanakae]|uniref:Uncharacterized protein n=1 Tax=Liparis tanakae TaxID=230148 RepID=A0A4Z2FC25_9TELE|nr:hypothetical protein EYF80_051367 [Liparis tanakae]
MLPQQLTQEGQRTNRELGDPSAAFSSGFQRRILDHRKCRILGKVEEFLQTPTSHNGAETQIRHLIAVGPRGEFTGAPRAFVTRGDNNPECAEHLLKPPKPAALEAEELTHKPPNDEEIIQLLGDNTDHGPGRCAAIGPDARP